MQASEWQNWEAKLGQTAKGKKQEDRSKSSWMPSRFEPQEKKCTAVHPDEKILLTTILLTLATFQWHFLEKGKMDKTCNSQGPFWATGWTWERKVPCTSSIRVWERILPSHLAINQEAELEEEVCASPLPVLQCSTTVALLSNSYILQDFHSSLLLSQRRRNPENSNVVHKVPMSTCSISFSLRSLWPLYLSVKWKHSSFILGAQLNSSNQRNNDLYVVDYPTVFPSSSFPAGRYLQMLQVFSATFPFSPLSLAKGTALPPRSKGLSQSC